MSSSPSISIILPVFNEEERIKSSSERILAYCTKAGWDFELIFVEDGSQDSTVEIIQRLQSADDHIKLMRLASRIGKGGSIKAAALYLARKEYIAFMDIDLSAEPSEFVRLFDIMKNCDVAIGSRILRGNLPPIKRPLRRSLFSHLYSKFFRLLFRMPIHDPQCGFKMFRRAVIPQLFSEVSINGFAFDTEIVVKAFSQGLRVKEVPINWIHGSSSKVKILRETFSMGSDILSLWYYHHLLWRQDKATYPFKKGSHLSIILFAMLSLILRKEQKQHITEMRIIEMPHAETSLNQATKPPQGLMLEKQQDEEIAKHV